MRLGQGVAGPVRGFVWVVTYEARFFGAFTDERRAIDCKKRKTDNSGTRPIITRIPLDTVGDLARYGKTGSTDIIPVVTDLPDLDELDFESSPDDALILGCMKRAEELDMLLADDAPSLADPCALTDFVFTASRYAMSVLPFFKVMQLPNGQPLSAPPQMTDAEKCGILLALDKRVDAAVTKMFNEANVAPNFSGVVQLRRLRTAVLGRS